MHLVSSLMPSLCFKHLCPNVNRKHPKLMNETNIVPPSDHGFNLSSTKAQELKCNGSDKKTVFA